MKEKSQNMRIREGNKWKDELESEEKSTLKDS